MITKFKNEHREVAAVHTQAVHHLASRWFTPAEIDAGAPGLSADYWKVRCRDSHVFVYKADGRVVGFVGLQTDGRLDGPFVRPGSRRLTVAQALLDHVAPTASALGIDSFTVVADRFSRDVFRSVGFNVHRSTEWALGSLKIPAVELRKSVVR